MIVTLVLASILNGLTPVRQVNVGEFIPGNYRPILGAEASPPVEIPVVFATLVEDDDPPSAPGFSYAITATDEDTYNFVYTTTSPPTLSNPLVTEKRPDDSTKISVGVCQYAVNPPMQRGSGTGGNFVWDVTGTGMSLPKRNYIGNTVFYNKYTVYNDRPVGNILIDAPVTVTQTLLVKKTAP